MIHINNIGPLHDIIKSHHVTLMRKYNLLVKKHNDKQIKKFVQQRCDDYKSDQSHMINSFLERNKKKIIINRLFYEDNGIQQFTTNPAEIKKLTNIHFQSCAGEFNHEQQIPDRWRE